MVDVHDGAGAPAPPSPATATGPGPGEGGVDLVHARYGVDLINCGALVEGLRAWSSVEQWGSAEIALVARTTDPDLLLNAVAEQHYGAFGPQEELGKALLAAGAVLGQRAGEAVRFFECAGAFLTRVVGCRYEGRLERLDDLQAGDPVTLVWEPDNPYDRHAIRVATTRGEALGYIRRTIARALAARIDRGAVLRAKAALVLGERYAANDRLYLKVEVAGESGSGGG